MEYDFQPYIGAGPLRFGMTTDEITNILGAPDMIEYFSNVPEYSLEYAYDRNGFSIYFNKEGCVEAMLFMPNTGLIFAGKNLKTVPLLSLRSWVWENDREIEEVEGFDFCSYRFGFFTTSLSTNHDPDTSAYSIMMFRRNYVEDMRAAANA
ncbi:MAG: hypothetical protein MnENMB40S_13220 [Rhizobiaceae bacterium MnEN-MB40S]|nr:MAG: hypothetical protein MnENMB40S_13220 [Rhizobiaceae bacterium MnEN-MB40S]